MPWRLQLWQHRFDDPDHRFRTVYAAVHKITCFREVVGDLAPSTSEVAEFQRALGTIFPELIPASAVSWQWRQKQALALGLLRLNGSLVDIDDVEVRRRLEKQHARLLARHGMEHLYIGEVRSTQRAVTQRIARSLYEEGAAGVLYRSNRDDMPCVALFEGAASLEPTGEIYPLTEPVPELLQVCSEYDLVLRSSSD